MRGGGSRRGVGEGRKDRVGAPGAEADPRNQEQTWGRSAERFGRMEPPSQVDSTSILVGDSGSSLEMQPDHPSPPPHLRLHSNPLSQHLAADSFLTGSASTAGRRSCSGWRSLWLSRCAHPRLGTAARGLLSPGPGVPGVRTREKKKRSAFRNLPGKRPTPKSNSSGSSSGGCGARGPLSSMAH